MKAITYICLLLLILSGHSLRAEEKRIEIKDRGAVIVLYEVKDTILTIIKVTNKTDVQIKVKIDGNECAFINSGDGATYDMRCRKNVHIEGVVKTAAKYFPQREVLKASEILPKPSPGPEHPKKDEEPKPEPPIPPTPTPPAPDSSMTLEQLYEMIDRDEFWGDSATSNAVDKAKDYANQISQSANKESYIRSNNILKFIEGERKRLTKEQDGLGKFVLIKVDKFCNQNKRISAERQREIESKIIEDLQIRWNERSDALQELETEVAKSQNSGESTNSPITTDQSGIANYCAIGAFILIVLILALWFLNRRSKKKDAKAETSGTQSPTGAESPTIVVHSRTASALKRMCIDDVMDSREYKKIPTSEFCPESAVRNIYIKNTCIKEIYDIYADDLRNTNKPNEDGCMVLGRWILDESSKAYDVTLETVVVPGDDAIFKEYELNFGGKIKLRVAEKLRKLRKDTNLQYDLTCWVHSHPGLGVFFSNSDSNVQMQLKHAQHPNFLIAFVIDILTDSQEMGIFTFRHDGTINSKQDLTQMYSLEELYKWAVESSKQVVSEENHYNIMKGADQKTESCKGVELDNSAIIDLSQIAMESDDTGLAGWAVGYQTETKNGQEYVVSSLCKNGEQPDMGVIGCLVSVSHMSLPTIKRILTKEMLHVNFILVYSIRQMTLTTIPVEKGEIVNDERYYAEETLENLKIWTRRKR